MSVAQTSEARRYGVRTVAAASAILFALGAMSVPGRAQPSGARARVPLQLAQSGNTYGIDICRDVFRRQGAFLPKHPKADQYGCVHPRFLQRGQRPNQRPDPGHVLRHTGSGANSRWESEWVRDHNKNDHITTFVHGLNRPPSSVMIWFRPKDSNAMYPVQWSWGASPAGNPVTVEARGNRIRLHIKAGRPLIGAWNARRHKWKHYKRGAWKVIILE
jgi:hypothetical protein